MPTDSTVFSGIFVMVGQGVLGAQKRATFTGVGSTRGRKIIAKSCMMSRRQSKEGGEKWVRLWEPSSGQGHSIYGDEYMRASRHVWGTAREREGEVVRNGARGKAGFRSRSWEPG